MAAQLATETLGVERVVAKINDPVRAEAYADLGHRDALPDEPDGRRDHVVPRPVRRRRWPGVIAPSGSHPGGERACARGPAGASGRAAGAAAGARSAGDAPAPAAGPTEG